jgi:hypothetical protein
MRGVVILTSDPSPSLGKERGDRFSRGRGKNKKCVAHTP